MRQTLYIAVVLLMSVSIISGCAVNSGIVPIGKDTFMVSRQAATGFTGLGTLKAEALREANKFCVKQEKQMQVIHVSESTPPYVLANFPRVEIQFRCLDEDDPELRRPTFKKEADISIEMNQ